MGALEMVVVETIAKVRHDYHVAKKSIKSIARDRMLSRNTVRKIIRSEGTEFEYKSRDNQPMPQLGGFRDFLEQLLKADVDGPERKKRTARSFYGELRSAGFKGSYDCVRRQVRRWRYEHSLVTAPVFIPLAFAPGDAYQFDWSHETVVLGGVTTLVKVAHIRLCHSRMPLVIAYPRETQEMVFDAHARAFAFFGGACQRGIYDNMKTAVETVFVGKKRTFNRRFVQMCSHYLVQSVACTPASGWEKGQVENQVDWARDNLFTPRKHFPDLGAMNEWLMAQCVRRAKEHAHPEVKDKTVWEMFEAEKTALIAVRGPFDGYNEKDASASKTCLVNFDRNKYSVHAKAARRPVQVRAYVDRVVIWCNGEVVGEHPRVYGRDKVTYDPWHYLPALVRKPGALRNGAPFVDWDLPPGLAGIRRRLGKGDDADRQFVGILAEVLEKGLEAVEAACLEALASGVCSKDAVVNILYRRLPVAVTETVATPAALALTVPPAADCARYDRLRDAPMEACDAAA